MPGTRCAVAVCDNNYEDSKKNNLNISFHTFPKDEKIKNSGIQACHRADIWNPKTSTICRVYFYKDDFETDLRAQLMNIKTKPRLKLKAIPNKLLRKNESHLNMTKELRDARAEKRLQRKGTFKCAQGGPEMQRLRLYSSMYQSKKYLFLGRIRRVVGRREVEVGNLMSPPQRPEQCINIKQSSSLPLRLRTDSSNQQYEKQRKGFWNPFKVV
ncbi:hypothetical protein NQ315_011015 [Exocentrus adspersus]|uniref:THAP-type domain-containing protein n=1 Tax=Exocentrus adspersus TaxID=1586481 RepID=A0AAV8VIW3_9CUCU|nr:hypothetical protein NQ315_011015 [Exocentrus adspersus]